MLGVITQATLKLIPKPEAKVVLLAIFKEWAQGGQTVADIFDHGILPTTCEIMDDTSIRAAEEYGHFGLPTGAGALLVIEVDGYREIAPTRISEDVTVPRSKVPELVVRLKEVEKEIGLPIVVFGHAGDGNLHPAVLTDRRDPDKWARAHRGIELIFKHTVALGGTLSGEHGVGYMKAPFLPLEYGERAIRLMKDPKQAVDPQGLLNPLKMFPDPRNPMVSEAGKGQAGGGAGPGQA
ncbi:MAG TPA: FAD-linked oxidase C-terminal domain-containing protein [Bacillota bacterium]|jgi:glycolate oxidase